MVIAVALLGLVAGLGLGFVLGRSRSTEADPASLAAARAETEAVRGELGKVRDDLEAARIEAAKLRTELDAVASLEEAERAMTDRFSKVSNDALTQATENLLKLAEQRFAAGDEQRKSAFHEEMAPISKLLIEYKESLQNLTKNQAQQFNNVMGQVASLKSFSEQIQQETNALSKALREPVTKGQWGELQLRRVVEFAGMVEHCDFNEQVHQAHEDGASRPDLVVHLPGGLNIIVDSKFPFTAYGKIAEATDEAGRKAATEEHGAQVKTHIKTLAGRRYQDKVEHAAPFVVIFLPADPLLSAALDADPTLYDFALSQGVLPASPTTLLALLHSAAFSWRNDKLAEEAQEVRRIGATLYERLSTMGGYLERLGKNLNTSVKSYNELVGSLESRVLTQAKRMRDLGVVADSKELPEAPTIELVAREVSIADPPDNVAELPRAEGEG